MLTIASLRLIYKTLLNGALMLSPIRQQSLLMVKDVFWAELDIGQRHIDGIIVLGGFTGNGIVAQSRDHYTLGGAA